MKDSQHAAYSEYLRTLADALLLRDWEIQLKRDTPTSDDCYAAVWVMDTENQAVIRLSEDYWHGSAEDRREWLVHELIHCHLDRPVRVMAQLARQWDENSACQFAKEAHRNEVEICVQRIARIVAPTLPLPPETGV